MGTRWLGKLLALVAVVGATNAYAEFDFNGGYFRTGGGFSSEGGKQVAFEAPGSESKYRLGNETGTYMELMLNYTLAKAEDGSTFKVHFMPAMYIPYAQGFDNLDTVAAKSWIFQQIYAEGIDIPFLNGGKAWVGKKYYKRHDVHIIDYFYWLGTGEGGGIEDINAGPLKLSYAAFFLGADANQKSAGLRHDIQASVAIPDGELIFGLQLSHGIAKDIKYKTGFGANFQWTQKLLGGENHLFAGYGLGGLSSRDLLLSTANDKVFRIVENLVFQLDKDFSGSLVGVWVNKAPEAGGKSNWVSVGGRLIYGVADHVKLALEVGEDYVKPEVGDAASVTKITFAPSLAPTTGHWSRPELRLFATYALWNTAARATVGDKIYAGTDKSGGLTYGLQAEAWW